MKKRILIIVLACVLVIGGSIAGCLAAKNCGTNSSSAQGSSQSSSEVSSQSSSSSNQPNEGGEDVDYTSLTFSNKNADKIITEPTFDISKHTANASASIMEHKVFGNGMCLQRDAINRIWGNIYNATKIAVELNGSVYYGTVANNKFEVYLPKMSAGGPYSLTVISDLGRETFTNVYIGEVFLLSGQSNMEYQMFSSSYLTEYYATDACINEQIRLFTVGWNTPNEPDDYGVAIAGTSWKGANKASIREFSAVAYLFGKQMQEELGCPVGIIENAVGGSSIEFWLSDASYSLVQESYTTFTDGSNIMTPSLGYNGMLYPLAGLNLRGFVWYQGESNAFGTQEYYDIALNIFINQLREMFDNEQLIFTACELARYEGLPAAYSIVNERINSVAKSDPYVIVARNLDQGDWKDIHPADKRAVAYRAAYETLRVFFKKDKPAPVEISDYTFNSDGSVTINLSCAASLRNGSNGFEVYVNGRYTYDCNVSISGNTLTVTANGAITKVRYGYTCLMTDDVKADVSKMVTVYDQNGFPLDLFIIVDESNVIPGMPDAPSFTSGYCDNGYEISIVSGEYVVNKAANAGQWTAAQLEVIDYAKEYDNLTIELTTSNVKSLCVQVVVGGITATTGTPYTMYIVLYQQSVSDGKQVINVNLNDIAMLDAGWQPIPGSSIKDYQIKSVCISLDTAVELNQLVKQDASCTIHKIFFTPSAN